MLLKLSTYLRMPLGHIRLGPVRQRAVGEEIRVEERKNKARGKLDTPPQVLLMGKINPPLST